MTAHVDTATESMTGSATGSPARPAVARWRRGLVLALWCVLGPGSVLGLAGCADRRGGDIPYDASHFTSPDPIALVSADKAYRMSPGDTLAVAVTRVPDLSGDATIDPTGVIALPLIGKVMAAGKTTDQLADEIGGKLSAKYLQNPEVHVVLKATPGQRITVDGAVSSPGVYPIAGATTLLQAIASAKGTTSDANSRKVAIFRTINGQREAAAFDLTDIRRGKATDPEVFGNDIIVVDGSTSKSRFKTLLQTLPLVTLFRPF